MGTQRLGYSVPHNTGSQVSQLPSINFLVYLPRKAEHPLFIVDPGDAKSPREGFLVPQWGGVVIYNAHPEPVSGAGHASLSVKMGRLMPVFIEQLAALLGVPLKVTGGGGNRGRQGIMILFAFPIQVPTIAGVEFSSSNVGVTDWVSLYITFLHTKKFNWRSLLLCGGWAAIGPAANGKAG